MQRLSPVYLHICATERLSADRQHVAAVHPVFPGHCARLGVLWTLLAHGTMSCFRGGTRRASQAPAACVVSQHS